MGDGDPGDIGGDASELSRLERPATTGGQKHRRGDDPGCSGKASCRARTTAGSGSSTSTSTCRRQIGRVSNFLFLLYFLFFVYLNLDNFVQFQLNVETFTAQIY
jgi:hypothetical protein